MNLEILYVYQKWDREKCVFKEEKSFWKYRTETIGTAKATKEALDVFFKKVAKEGIGGNTGCIPLQITYLDYI